MLKIPLYAGLLVLALACAPTKSITAELQPTTLQAVNLEETLSRRDELMLAYSLTSYDAANRATAVVNGGWGVEVVRKGQQLNLPTLANPALPIQLPVPPNGRVVASLVLIEVDDYNRAQKLLEQVRRIHNIVAGPASFLLTATEVLTPLRYIAAGLVASGLGMTLMDHLDDDDLLGQSSVDLREADLRQNRQGYVRVPVVFSGQNLRDAFDYRLSYDIRLIKGRPKKNQPAPTRLTVSPAVAAPPANK